ncbi:MAG: hypothetical protein AABO58_00825 [Acidobacteriota bacterium]
MPQSEGTIMFFAKPAEPGAQNWFADAEEYKFPPAAAGGITVEALKRKNGTVAVTVTGLPGVTSPDGRLHFLHEMPRCDTRGLHVVVTWTRKDVILYLNAVEVARREFAV